MKLPWHKDIVHRKNPHRHPNNKVIRDENGYLFFLMCTKVAIQKETERILNGTNEEDI